MKQWYFLLLAICVWQGIAAQGIKISSSSGSPDPSAILEVQSNTQGWLPPRMTTAERNAIVDPATGLTIFNTTTQCMNIRLASGWKQVCGDCDFNSPVVSNNGPICEPSLRQQRF